MIQKRISALAIFMTVAMVLQLSGCSNSSIRNPFKGRPQVALGPLPPMTDSEAMTVVWQEKATKGSAHFNKIRPEVSSSMIYQASFNGTVTAMNKQSGKKIWKVETDLPISSGPSRYGDFLFVGTKDARVVALHASNGLQAWQAPVTSEVLSPPQSNGHVVLVSSIDGQLTALDHKNGQKMWSYERSVPALTLRGGSAPVLLEDQALAGFANGKLVALDLKNGSLAWERTISVPRGRSELHRLVDIHSTPVVKGQDVYVATYQGNVVAIDLSSGQVKWERQLSSYRDLEVDDNALYLTDKEHQLWALDRKSGVTLWKQAALERRFITGPAQMADFLMVGDQGGYVHWLRKSNGELVGRQSVGKKILQTPVSTGDMVYVTSNNGQLTALALPVGGGA